jgi:hypothetical protein
MIEFPDSPATGDLHSAGGASWRWDGVKWTADTTGPLLAQGEVLGNPNPADAEAIPAGLTTMLRADLGDGVAGQALLSGGPAVDAGWGDIPTAPTPPVLHQGEVLGNPSAPDGGAVAASLEAMLRRARGRPTARYAQDGAGSDTAGQFRRVAGRRQRRRDRERGCYHRAGTGGNAEHI